MGSRFNCYLDRFEGDFAILLVDGREISLPRHLLPDGAAEGDHLTFVISIDSTSRNRSSREISELQQRLGNQEDRP